MKERTTRIMLGIVILWVSTLLVRDSRTASAAEPQHGGEPAPGPPRESLRVVNERGEVRAQLYLGEDGGGNIRLRGKTGDVRVKLGVSTDGNTGLLVLDENVSPAVQLVTSPSEGTSLSLKEKGKEKRISPTSK